MLALQECVDMITTSAGGCTTPFPFEAAIWLLEEQEELYGGNTPVYNTGRALSSVSHCWLCYLGLSAGNKENYMLLIRF